MTQDSMILRGQDLLHRIRRAIAGSQSTIDPPFGDSPNLPDIYYVDSGNGSDGNDGRDPGFPMATIDAAINRCTASQGDTILVQPGHSETVTTGIALDVIGVSVIGVGEGTLRPQLTLNEDNGDCISITAANCSVENLQFNEAVDNISGEQTGSDINIAAAYAVVKGCHFDAGIYDTEQITITADGDYAVIEDCAFYVTADGPNAGIEIEASGCVGLKVSRCYFNGMSTANAWDVGAINSGVAHTLCLIEYNIIDFCASSTGGIQFTTTCSGTIQYNTLTNGTLTEMLDPGSCHCIQNFEQDAIDESGVLFPDVNPSGTVGGGAHGTAESTDTDTLHGKIGTDTEMSDRSLWDILEGDGFVAGPTAALPAINVNIHDELAWIANAVRPGTGTVLGTNESLADVLYATNGIVGSFPAGAAPTGTGVSLAQAIRYISESLRDTTGAYIPTLGTKVTKAGTSFEQDDLFTVTGKVLVTLIVGEVTTAFTGGDSSQVISLRLKTTQEALCADTTVDGDVVETQYMVSGDFGEVLCGADAPTLRIAGVSGTGGPNPFTIGSLGGVSTEIIENEDVSGQCTAGVITWYLYYWPLEASASVVVA